MATQITGTVIGGQLKLDAPIPLPNDTRVTVIVAERKEIPPDWHERFETGLADMLELMERHPIHSGGVRFTREELHERRA